MSLYQHLFLTLASIFVFENTSEVLSENSSINEFETPISFVAPIVDLGLDTVACGPITLDAGNAGATYLWSTGETSQTVVVNSSDTIWVDVTDISGTTRDSIAVFIFSTPSTPSLNNIDICGPGEVDIITSSNGDNIFWYDSMIGDSIIGSGDSLAVDVPNSKAIYAESVNYLQHQLGPINPTSVGSLKTSSGLRGFAFDAFDDLIIQQVTVFPTYILGGPLSFDLELKDANDISLEKKSFIIHSPATEEVLDVFIDVPAGNGYKLIVDNIVGGKLSYSFQANNLPMSLPNIMSILSTIPTTFHYYYLYDLKIIKKNQICASNRTSADITVLPAPIVSFQNDTILCGGATLSLDMTNSGATYLWSTGSTSPTLSISTTGTFWGEATIGTCTARDTVSISKLAIPNVLNLSDTTICGQQIVPLNVTSNTALTTLWYESSNLDKIIHFDPSFSPFVKDTTTFFINELNYISRQLGASDNTVGESINDANADRGILFDAYSDFILQRITVYPRVINLGNPKAIFDIELRDASDSLLDIRHIEIINPGTEEEIDLFIKVKAGLGLKLMATNIEESNLYFSAKAYIQNSPYELPGIARIYHTVPASNHYYYLFNWQVIQEGFSCQSPLSTLTVDVNLPLNLPDSLYECEAFTFDPNPIQNANSYMWSTGTNTRVIDINESGTYILTVSDGVNCSVSDTLEVEIPLEAGLQDDGILCGNTLGTNYGSNSSFVWSTGDSSETIVISDPGIYSVLVEEPNGCFLADTIDVTGFRDFPIVNLGNDTSVCVGLNLDAGDEGVEFNWSTGDSTQTISISSSGSYNVMVTNSDGCAGSDSISVSVTPKPTAAFFIPDTVANANLTVTFNNLSSFGTYTWDFGDGTSSALNNPVHIFPGIGEYCVELVVTDILNSCGSDTVLKCFTLIEYNVGLEEDIFNGLKIYPNPTTDICFIEFPQVGSGEWKWSLSDLRGRILDEEKHSQINPNQIDKVSLGQFPAGIYFLTVHHNYSIKVKKIIKK